MKKIVYGICGIGNGHTYRQLPIISDLAKDNKILIFAYGESLIFYKNYFKNHPQVRVVEVAVPYYAGDINGINFTLTLEKIKQSKTNFTEINTEAFIEAASFIQKPDLVISDYEPTAAQYAYLHNAPLVTIDQQSKFLSGKLSETLHGTGFTDEVQRLGMFFPLAGIRMACSFFTVEQAITSSGVHIYPAVIRPELMSVAKKKPRAVASSNHVTVYLSAQPGFKQSTTDIIRVLSTLPETTFHIFAPQQTIQNTQQVTKNIQLYAHGHEEFDTLLTTSSAVIANAGHTLLSEAMYLNLPVLALPLPLYEQQLNAEVIHKNSFGMSAPFLSQKIVRTFLARREEFHSNIAKDTTVLTKEDGSSKIIKHLRAHYLK